MYSTKQVIVMRTDLNMRKGKMVAQGAHASIAFLTRRLATRVANAIDSVPKAIFDTLDYRMEIGLNDREIRWLHTSFAKICVGVDSEAQLLNIRDKAQAAGVEVHVITDNGKTEFAGVPTITCLAIGPDYCDKIDAITGSLKLL